MPFLTVVVGVVLANPFRLDAPPTTPPTPVAAPAAVVPVDRYVWPLRPRPQIVRRFQAPPQPWAAGNRGVDLLGSDRQTVYAAGAGTVSFSGVVAGRGVVSVTHPNGWRTTYEPVDDRIAPGSTVGAGDRIGVLSAGSASHCAPSVCLHWGLLIGDRTYRDPLTLLQRREVILLPLA